MPVFHRRGKWYCQLPQLLVLLEKDLVYVKIWTWKISRSGISVIPKYAQVALTLAAQSAPRLQWHKP